MAAPEEADVKGVALCAATVASASVIACGGAYLDDPVRYVATDGTVLTGVLRNDNALSEKAVQASAVQDLPCPRERISVEKLPGGSRGPTEYMAAGCGWRAIFREQCSGWGSDEGMRCRFILTGRFALAPASGSAP